MATTNKPFTLQERKNIERLLKMNFSCSSISKEINRSKNGVISEVRRNGGRNNYNAEKAYREAMERLSLKKKNLSELNKNSGNHPMTKVKARIDNLEMQLEILYDTIKEMKNDKKNR